MLEACDRNRDGTITVNEFDRVLKDVLQYQFALSDEQVCDMVAQVTRHMPPEQQSVHYEQ